MGVFRAVLTFAIVFNFSLAANSVRADDPGAGSISILSGSTVVQPLNGTSWSVKADLDLMAAPTISGHVTATGGAGNDIQLLVLTESDYVNWQNKHAVTPIYDSGQVTAADVKVRLPASGTYYVLLSNVFSTFTPKTVEGTLQLSWQPSAAVLARRQLALDAMRAAAEAHQKAKNTLVVVLLVIVVSSAAAGGGIAVLAMRRNGKGKPENLDKAA